MRGSSQPVEQVQAAEDALAEALLLHDCLAIGHLLAEDSAMMMCKRLLRGREQIVAMMERCLQETETEIVCECLQIEVLHANLLAFTRGALLDASDLAIVGAFESIWRHSDDGQWRLIFVQASFTRAVVGIESLR
jgi:ketosteroid isomerase-like protein